MRISQLAATADLPVATVKYYLREGLLHDGVLTSATQAQYDETHVSRLALVRALVGPAALSVSAARDVLSAIDSPPASAHDLLGVAHHAVARQTFGAERSPAQALLDRLGWMPPGCEADPAVLDSLADALAGLHAAGFELTDETVDRYAAAMRGVAITEIAEVPTDSIDAAIRYVVLGTVLVEPLLLALRRLAQQAASVERFGAP